MRPFVEYYYTPSPTTLVLLTAAVRAAPSVRLSKTKTIWDWVVAFWGMFGSSHHAPMQRVEEERVCVFVLGGEIKRGGGSLSV